MDDPGSMDAPPHPGPSRRPTGSLLCPRARERAGGHLEPLSGSADSRFDHPQPALGELTVPRARRLRAAAAVLLAWLPELAVPRGFRQAMALALLEEFAAVRGLGVSEVLVLLPGAGGRALAEVDRLLAIEARDEDGDATPGREDWGERPLAQPGGRGQSGGARRWRVGGDRGRGRRRT